MTKRRRPSSTAFIVPSPQYWCSAAGDFFVNLEHAIGDRSPAVILLHPLPPSSTHDVQVRSLDLLDGFSQSRWRVVHPKTATLALEPRPRGAPAGDDWDAVRQSLENH